MESLCSFQSVVVQPTPSSLHVPFYSLGASSVPKKESTGVSRAPMNPPVCTSFLLTAARVFFDANSLNFFLKRPSLLFCASVTGTFPFNTFRAHSQRQHKRYLLQFFKISFRIMADASLSSFRWT